MVKRSFRSGPAAIILSCILLFSGCAKTPQTQEAMMEDRDAMHQSKAKALEAFNEAKFGMFIHWGVYSVPAGIWKGEKIPGLGEWIFYHAQIPREEYKAMCRQFNPVKFDAEAWVKVAKMAGMKYIVAMPKHHDGFAMYDSKVTDYDIMDATPFGRDPMAELYEACQKHGIRFAVYYSHATDWMNGGDAGVADYIESHPDEKSLWPANTWDPSPVSFTDYLENKSKPQMIEILTKFPNLQEIWYDVPGRMTLKQSYEFYKLAYELQPGCLINSRVGNGLGDFWIPGDNKIPENEEAADIFWETPGTLNNTWGFKSYDVDWKSTEELIYWITEIASKGGNYLLNVGPTPEGLFPEESMKQLASIGQWMGINGESVYGTTKWMVSREGPTQFSMKGTRDREKHGFSAQFTSEDFWFSAKDDAVYVTCLKWPDSRRVVIRSFAELQDGEGNPVESIQMLGTDNEVGWKMTQEGLQVSLPQSRPSEYGYVLKVELSNETAD